MSPDHGLFLQDSDLTADTRCLPGAMVLWGIDETLQSSTRPAGTAVLIAEHRAEWLRQSEVADGTTDAVTSASTPSRAFRTAVA